MPSILPRRAVRVLTILGLVGLFSTFLRNATVYTSFPTGGGKSLSLGHGQGRFITVTRIRTAWAEVTRTIMAEPEPTTHPQHIRQHPLTNEPLKQHKYRSDGLLEVNPNGPHPIFELIRNAEKEWEAKLASSSKTLAQAVAEYQRRYKRLPPLGFNDWFVGPPFSLTRFLHR